MEERETTGKEISIIDILNVVKDNLLLIVLVVVLFMVAGYAYSQFYLPTNYTAKAEVIIDTTDVSSQSGTSTGGTEQTQYNYATYITNAIPSIMKCAGVRNETVEYLKKNDKEVVEGGVAKKYLDGSLSFGISDKNPVFTVTYTTQIDQTTTEEELTVWLEYLLKYVEDTNFGRGETPSPLNYFAGKIRVISWPKDFKIPASKDTIKTIIIFTLVGIVLCAAYVIIRYLVDDTFKDKDEVEKITGTDVIAFVLYVDSDSKSKSKGRR